MCDTKLMLCICSVGQVFNTTFFSSIVYTRVLEHARVNLADRLNDSWLLLLLISGMAHFSGADLYTKLNVSNWLVATTTAHQWLGLFLRC